jgi:chemotaxis protein MotB
MKRSKVLVSLVPMLLAAGCVSQERYDKLVTEYNSENQARRQLEDVVARRDGELSDLKSMQAQKDEQLSSLQQSSEQDKAKIAQLQAALDDAKKNMGSSADGVEIIPTIDGFAYRIQDKLLFESGSTKISEAGKSTLLKVAKEITEKGYKDVRIDGYTDSDPVVKTKKEYPLGNHELAIERALAVFGILVKDGKVPEKVFTIAGYGPNRPIAQESSDAGKAKNRRVEIHVAVPKK